MTIPTIKITGIRDAAIGKDKRRALIVLLTPDGTALPLEFDARSAGEVAPILSQYASALSSQIANLEGKQVRAAKLHALQVGHGEGSEDVILSLSSTPDFWVHFTLPANEIDEFCLRLQRAKSDAIQQKGSTKH